MAAVSRGRSGRGGRGRWTWRTMRAWSGRADGRTGADEAVGRMSGRADGAERSRTVGRTGAERVRTVEWTGRRGPRGADTQTGGRGADGAQEAQTGRSRHGRADGRTSGWADWGGRAYWQSAGRADGRTSGWAWV